MQFLNQFRSVTIEPVEGDLPEPVKPLVVRVTELSRQVFDFGASISTGEGARVDLEYTYRNIFGLAVDCSLRGALAWQFIFLDTVLRERFTRLSTLDRLERRLGVGCTVPFVGIDNLSTNVSLQHQRDNERNFGLTRNGIDLTFTHRTTRWLTSTVSTGVEINEVTLFADGDDYQTLLENTTDARLRRLLRVPAGETSIVSAGLSLHADFRDNPFNPTNGILLTSDTEWAHTLASEPVNVAGELTRFYSHHLRLELGVSGYIPLYDQFVLALQAQYGRVIHLENTSETYPNRKFFLGGSNTIRGYLEDAMVPQDVADSLIGENVAPGAIVQGGDTFLVLRAELRFPIISFIGGGVFFDMGNLWAGAGNIDLMALRPTVGLGLRLATPIGPIALDYGILLQRREKFGENFGAFHFSIGLF